MVEVVDAKDFVLSSFRVAISRVQQVALDRESTKIPCPQEQLALLQQKKKKRDADQMILSLISFTIYTIYTTHAHTFIQGSTSSSRLITLRRTGKWKPGSA